MFDLHIDSAADSWFSALPAPKQVNWGELEEAFIAQFVDYEPSMVTESKYASRVWNGTESLDEYLTALTSLANKLNRPNAQAMLKFVQGLPQDYQDFVLSTFLIQIQ